MSGGGITWPLAGASDSVGAPDYAWSGHTTTGLYYNTGIGFTVGGSNVGTMTTTGLNQPVGELSGGNQQKVTVARSIARKPRLIVAIAPTRGVDVASKALLLAELAAVTEQSRAGLLLASDELSDLDICERVVVLVRGERFTEFGAPPFDREALIAATEGLATGGSAQQRQTDSYEQGPPS